MNVCREWHDRLLDLALGGLSAARARAVEAHLDDCPRCAAALDELRARADEIDAATRELAQAAELSPGFPARLRARLETRAPGGALRGSRFALAGGLAVVVLIVAGVAVFLLAPRGVRHAGISPATMEPPAGLSTWRSPTERLLHPSGEELLRSAPRLGGFYFSVEPARDGRRKGRGGNRNET